MIKFLYTIITILDAYKSVCTIVLSLYIWNSRVDVYDSNKIKKGVLLTN